MDYQRILDEIAEAFIERPLDFCSNKISRPAWQRLSDTNFGIGIPSMLTSLMHHHV